MDERITEVVRYFNNNTSFDKVSTLSDWYVRQLTDGRVDGFGRKIHLPLHRGGSLSESPKRGIY